MATILRTIFLNIISMKTYVIWLNLYWNLPAFVQLTSISFKCIFFNSWLQIRLPLKWHCKEIYHFMNAHTLALLISRVCIYKHNLYILNYILRRRKFILTPDNAHLFYIIVLYYCVSHISVFFSIDKIKIFIIIIIYELIASGWRRHVSGI